MDRIISVATSVSVIAFIFTLLVCTGCANRGIKVVASTASATNIGDVNWEEYKIPVFSVISGPRTTVWVNKDYLALRKVHAGGSTTNETSALGIYDDRGSRTNFVELEFRDATNACAKVPDVVSAICSAFVAARGTSTNDVAEVNQ